MRSKRQDMPRQERNTRLVATGRVAEPRAGEGNSTRSANPWATPGNAAPFYAAPGTICRRISDGFGNGSCHSQAGSSQKPGSTAEW